MNINTKYRMCPVCKNISGKKIITLKGTDLIRCTKCSMVFADIEKQIVRENNTYCNQIFFKYLKKEHFITAAYYDKIIKKIKKHFPDNSIRLLEFGCGSGQFLLRTKKYHIDSFGSDFSPYAELAKKYFNLNIEVSDIFETKYEPESFDVIISHATYEHIYELTEITQKLLTLLKKNGLFIISGVPNFGLLSRRFFNNYHINTPPGHINYFEKKSMKEFFNKMNISSLKIKSCGFDYWFIKDKIKSILPNKSESKTPNKETKKEIITEFKDTEKNIRFIHKILANLYIGYGIFLPGKSIEAWALKK